MRRGDGNERHPIALPKRRPTFAALVRHVELSIPGLGFDLVRIEGVLDGAGIKRTLGIQLDCVDWMERGKDGHGVWEDELLCICLQRQEASVDKARVG